MGRAEGNLTEHLAADSKLEYEEGGEKKIKVLHGFRGNFSSIFVFFHYDYVLFLTLLQPCELS